MINTNFPKRKTKAELSHLNRTAFKIFLPLKVKMTYDYHVAAPFQTAAWLLNDLNQDPSESVDKFAFKYKNIIHQLDKLGESLINPLQRM